ncbi:MAG: transglutaminase-like domain-containing protein [Planctomycetota bacterium]
MLVSIFPLSGCSDTKTPVDMKKPAAQMETHITYKTVLENIGAGAKTLRLWIPVPESDDFQQISNLTIEPNGGEAKRDAIYGNNLLYFEWKNPADKADAQKNIIVTVQYDLVRKEAGADHRGKEVSRDAMKRFLEGDHRAPITDRVKEYAAKATEGKADATSKARAIYDFVLDSLHYSKEGEGWGNGDIQFVCDSKRGNCSDFHTLFIAMARAAGIHARFHYGFSLKPGGSTSAHCWAAFFDDTKNWIPVDISEADKVIDKDPSKRDYFFGTLTENRVLLTTGRDLILEPKQSCDPLNFMYAPHAEVDGQPFPTKLDMSHQVKK